MYAKNKSIAFTFTDDVKKIGSEFEKMKFS